MRTKPKTNGTPPLVPLDTVRIKGVDAIVLEVKGNKAVIQFDTGDKLTVPVSDCRKTGPDWKRTGNPKGRPPKADKDDWMQVTCVLKKDTIERLRETANSRHFGQVLQYILDKTSVPSREQYLAMKMGSNYYLEVKRNKKIPVLIAAGLSREARKQAKEAARRERLSPEDRAWEDQIRETVTAAVR